MFLIQNNNKYNLADIKLKANSLWMKDIKGLRGEKKIRHKLPQLFFGIIRKSCTHTRGNDFPTSAIIYILFKIKYLFNCV